MISEHRMLQRYVEITKEFVGRSVSANEFSLQFLNVYKAEDKFFDQPTTEALDALFYAAEDYVEDPLLRDADDVDEVRLLLAAEAFLSFMEG